VAGENGRTLTATRRDPLRTFQFRLRLIPDDLPKGPKEPSSAAGTPPGPGRTPYIAGVRAVSGLAWSLSVHETWSGGNNYHRYANPDRIAWEPITLEQGIALDSRLEEWADAARSLHGTGFLSPVKRSLVIDVWDGAVHSAGPSGDPPGAVVRSYTVHNAWVRKFVALPKLDAMTSEVAFHSVEVIHEGWSVGKG
jgi:phage tail-like protein